MNRLMTASFFTFKGPGRVSIARTQPKGVCVPSYRQLAPGPWYRTAEQWEYRRLYFAQLARLNPAQVVQDLEALAGGATPVLLCWETLKKPGEWCHRRMVAEWLETELGLIVPEHGASGQAKKEPPEQGGLF